MSNEYDQITLHEFSQRCSIQGAAQSVETLEGSLSASHVIGARALTESMRVVALPEGRAAAAVTVRRIVEGPYVAELLGDVRGAADSTVPLCRANGERVLSSPATNLILRVRNNSRIALDWAVRVDITHLPEPTT